MRPSRSFSLMGLFIAATCFTARAQDAPKADISPETVDGWILGANGKVLRMDPDGTRHNIHDAPGLRFLRVIPGTKMVVAGSASGVELYDGEAWRDICRGPWEQIAFSPNYRTISVLQVVNGQRQVDITQLRPDIRNLEAYPLPREPQHLLGYRWLPLTISPGLMGTPEFPSSASWALPSARGELAFRSQYYMYSPDGPTVAVWISVDGKRLPVEFIATSDAASIAYATVMTSPDEGHLLGLDMEELRAKVKDEAVLGDEPKPTLEMSLAEVPKLVKLDAPVDRVVPCPAPFLCMISSGRLVALNTEDGKVSIVRRNMEDLEPFRWQGSLLGYAWYIESVQPCRLLAVAPAKRFNEMAMDTAYRMVSVSETRAVRPLGTDIIGLVGFGPYRWPKPREQSIADAPGPPGGGLEKLKVHPVEGERPEAVIFVNNRTYAVATDGSFEEWRGSLFRANGDYQLSADRKVLLANAGTDAMGRPQGPMTVYTSEGALIHPDGGLLSADGKRIWPQQRDGVESYDTESGDLKLLLPFPAALLPNTLPPMPLHGPEFAVFGETVPGRRPVMYWLVADEAKQAWVKTLPACGPGVGQKAVFKYADGIGSAGAATLWKGPHGGALVVEQASGARLYMLTKSRFSTWTEDAQPVAKEFMVASQWPLDPLTDTAFSEFSHMNADGSTGGPDNLLIMISETRRFQTSWSEDGARAILKLSRQPRPRALLVNEDGSTLLLPDTYSFVDFASDGKSLLAVINRQLIEPTAPANQQVLVKMDLAANKVTWTSQPFTNCQGIVPYPAFSLKEFHDPGAAGLD